ncbi:MAG: type II toxin-antitoxin system VapC family toxin [Nodosilinea sp.]
MTGPRFLLDTNVVSEPLKPQPNAKVLRLLRIHGGAVAIAAVTYHEMKYGCLKLPASQKRQRLELYLQQRVEAVLPIFPYDDQAAAWHAIERERLTKQGKTPPYLDSQIAAIAAVNRLTLVTRNITDFESFQDLPLENWFD